MFASSSGNPSVHFQRAEINVGMLDIRNDILYCRFFLVMSVKNSAYLLTFIIITISVIIVNVSSSLELMITESQVECVYMIFKIS